MSDDKAAVEEFKLEKESELRVDVDKTVAIELELVAGMAEVFGTELVKHRRYHFRAGAKFAVFTWHGCTLNIRGKTEFAYVSQETPMVMYVNVHAALEQLRKKSEDDGSRGPRVMICGQTDVGKSTLCRLVCNYALRLGRSPLFVDLDVGQGHISLPGTVGAVVRERPTELDELFPQESALVLHYGHKSLSDNTMLYNYVVSRLAELVNLKCQRSAKVNHSGVVINTCGFVRNEGYQCLLHIAGSFEVDVVVILDNERLYSQIQKDMPDFVKVLHLPKSGGVVDRSREARAEWRDQSIREYFYGSQRIRLSPYAFEVKFADASVYKVGAPAIPESMLPVGMTADSNRLRLMPVQPSQSLIHSVMSVSAATSSDNDEPLNKNVLGFIVINHVDLKRQAFHVLSPCPRPLPSTVLLLMEDIRFLDTSGVADYT